MYGQLIAYAVLPSVNAWAVSSSVVEVESLEIFPAV